MKVPFAVTAGDLSSHIAQASTTVATLFKLKRRDGVVMGFTDCDTDLAFDDLRGDGLITYAARTGYRRSAIQNKSDLSPPSVTLAGVLDSEAITETELRGGVYDKAEISLYLVNHADLRMGAYWIRRGFLGEVSLVDNGYEAELLGLTDAYTQQIIDIYTRDCSVDLFSTKCGVDPAAYTDSGVVTGITSRYAFSANISATGRADGFYDQGKVVWLSGANIGRTIEVKQCTIALGAVSLSFAAPFAINVGDTFNISAGCDKLRETCRDKFANIVNFRGPAVFCPDLDAVTKTPSLL